MMVRPLVSADKLCDYAAFSDESHTSGKDRFMVIGGIMMRTADVHLFSEKVATIKSQYPHFPETLQWKTLSKAKIELYKRVIDAFLEWQSMKRADFGCVIFERCKINHKKYNSGDIHKGFFKFVYQHHLCHSRYSRYGRFSTFRCYHGNMETLYDINELRKILNNGANLGRLPTYDPYKIVEFMPVKKSICLQVSDILIGAVGFIANEKADENPLHFKSSVALHFQANSPVELISTDTEWNDFGFSIWNFDLGT